MERFAGRVAVVTGASSGIGACIASDLAKAGMVVVGVARRKDRLQDLAASLKACGATGRLEAVQADLSSVEEVRRVFQWVEDNLGAVSVLVNNAAILLQKPIQDLDATDIQSLVTTNVTTVLIGCKEAINSMKKHDIKDGHIITINSVAGHVVINNPLVSVSAYTTSKHAITALCKSLRFDVQRIPGFKIRVTSLSPGTVSTDMVPAEFQAVLPPDMLLRAADVSNAVLYALSCPAAVEITELTIQPTGEALEPTAEWQSVGRRHFLAMERFAGRVAVVTGASSGIGACIASDLAKAGMVVVGVARRKDRLQDLAASLKACGATGRLEAVQADLSSVEEVRRVFQWVEDNLGGVSVLVNNAAIAIQKSVQDMDLADIQSIVATNVTSVTVGCKEAIESMKKHGIKDGHIININSVAGHVVINTPHLSISLYSATKHAITALCKGLRFDVQRIAGFKIRVTSLSPGAVDTDMVPEEFAKTLPPDMLLRPADISNGVLYALSCPSSVEITELTIQPTGEAF
ncbi:11-beta-hydroxysteroid dehydrogenase-like 6 [Thrips palmi]|uniref:11-beta-hydroxysteroid dehydrogenase-like 6 n=1 Tax=Thrips palmi TaxID=161013 RepID=A0A6P9AN68_THRPL|nr:11-beta-hydroxysteroid dehydrogenase-like 6 [Thrips palmi]